MNWFYNDYQKLVRENNDAIARLSEESTQMLQKMYEYMMIYNISLFELEVIKKDLIGAIREAEIEGIDFKDTLGMTEKEFCDSLVREGTEHIRGEHMILTLRNGILDLFAFSVFYWLLDGMPAEYGIPVEALFIGVWCAAWDFVIKYRIRGLSIYRLTDRGNKRLTLGGRIGLAIVFATISEYIRSRRLFLVRGNGVVILLILFLLSAAAFFGNNYYWNRRAEKYNWR